MQCMITLHLGAAAENQGKFRGLKVALDYFGEFNQSLDIGRIALWLRRLGSGCGAKKLRRYAI